MSGSRFHPRGFSRKLAAAFVLLAAFVSAFVACTTSSSTAVPPTTGILIRAETLTGDRGCGPGPTRLFKYAVVLYTIRPELVGTPAEAERSSYSVPFTSTLFDCYADGTFVSLPSTNGNATYRLEVFAFNDSAFDAATVDIDRGVRAHDAAVLKTASPTWTTECMATQQENVQALANCDPLRPGLSGLGGNVETTRITLATQAFTVNGRLATCVPGTDAGTDAATSDAGDEDAAASDAGDVDAAAPPPAPLTFSQVRIQPRVGAATVGPVEIVTCPTPYLADVTPEPAPYSLDVTLLDSAGNPVSTDAQTVCTVASEVGKTTSAVCP